MKNIKMKNLESINGILIYKRKKKKTGQRLQNYQRCSTVVKSCQWHAALNRIYSIDVYTLLNFIMLI